MNNEEKVEEEVKREEVQRTEIKRAEVRRAKVYINDIMVDCIIWHYFLHTIFVNGMNSTLIDLFLKRK